MKLDPAPSLTLRAPKDLGDRLINFDAFLRSHCLEPTDASAPGQGPGVQFK